MKCELCKKNEATMHFKQAFDGNIQEKHLCKDCAEKSGFDVQSPMLLTDFLFGVEVQQQDEPLGVDKICPNCDMCCSDFQKTSRLGCTVCYETFSDELRVLLVSMQMGDRHIGKVPRGEKISREIMSMQKKLDEAVTSQDFEKAAELRDSVRNLETKQERLKNRKSKVKR